MQAVSIGGVEHFFLDLFLCGGGMVSVIYFRTVLSIIMISESTVIDVSGSLYVRVPKPFADYFKLKPDKCKIEDVGDNEAKITFTKWR